jgi:predicted RND superfamily exporter protein
MGAFSTLLLRHRRMAGLLILAITLGLLPGVFRLGIGYSVESFLRTDDAQLLREVEHYDAYPKPDTFFSFGLPADDPVAHNTLVELQRFEEAVLQVDGVQSIITVRNAPGLAGLEGEELHKKLDESSLYRRLFVSFPGPDQDGALAGLVQLHEAARNNDDRRRIFKRMREIATTMPALRQGDEHLVLRSAGLPVLRDQFVALVKSDQRFFLPVGAALTILFLLFLLPGMGLALATVSIVPLTLVWTFGLLGYLGCELSLLTSTLPILLMVIATADAVHLSMRYWEERCAGEDRVEAARRAVQRTAFPCLVTTLTTMIGFGSMMLAQVPDLQDLGLFAATGVVLAFVLTILFLPVALPWCAERFWRIGPARSQAQGAARAGAEAAAGSILSVARHASARARADRLRRLDRWFCSGGLAPAAEQLCHRRPLAGQQARAGDRVVRPQLPRLAARRDPRHGWRRRAARRRGAARTRGLRQLARAAARRDPDAVLRRLAQGRLPQVHALGPSLSRRSRSSTAR